MVTKTAGNDKIGSRIDPSNNEPSLGPPSLKLAIIAQSLYLVNLLAVPGLTMIVLFYVTWRHRQSDDKLGVCHLRHTSVLSLWFVFIVVGGTLLIWYTVGHSSDGISMAILYAIVMHTSFVLLGVLGLANAMSGKHFHSTTKNNLCR